jgi:predicted ATPase/transcriptional regulator with XRE-family HTH domain
MHDMPFGQLLRQLRRDYGLTQEDLAEQVGCSIETISKIERGERRPSKQVAERIAQVLDVPATERPAFVRAARLLSRSPEEPTDARPALKEPGLSAPVAQPTVLPLSAAPPARTQATLPVPPTPFVGRQAELNDLAELLANPACRLLTLTGPGGIGKTRLALEAAARHSAAYAHGAVFVPLASVATGDLVASAIAEALGFTFYGPADFPGQLVGYLRDRSLLLALDSVEHLLGGPVWNLLAEIGRQAPGVKLLVTSRERLNLQGEWVVELAGLPPPPEELGAGFEESSAVALFLQTARRAQSGFALSIDERACIARICRLVEGMPLAIELAAAWVRVLPCSEIAAEIERTLDFLAASARDIPARHRSLRAVFDHSLNLLTEEERAAFRMLAVFRGGFRREAAEWVAGATLHLLTALADKSLLRRNKAGRYDMHELVRQYAAAQLAANPDEHTAARDRHSGYFLTLLQRRERDMKGSLQKAVLAELVVEADNLRPAWDWAVEQRKAAEVRGALRSLSWFYEIRGWLQEGEAVFRRASEAFGGPHPPAPSPTLGRGEEVNSPSPQVGEGGWGGHAPVEQIAALGHLLAHHGWFCLRQGRHGQAQASLQRGLALLRTIEDPIALADTLTALGMVTHLIGDSAAAKPSLTEGFALGRTLADDWVLVLCLGGLAMAAHALGEYEEAERLARECLTIARRSGNPRGIVFAISTFSMAAAARGLHADAQALLRESLELSSTAGDYWGIGNVFSQIGAVARTQGAYATAQYCFRESIAMFREIGDYWSVTRALINLGETSAASGDGAEARRAYGDAWRMANDAQTVPAALDALMGLAALAAKEQAAGLALELSSYVLSHPLSSRSVRARAEQLCEALALLPTPAPARPIEAVVAEMLGSDL